MTPKTHHAKMWGGGAIVTIVFKQCGAVWPIKNHIILGGVIITRQ